MTAEPEDYPELPCDPPDGADVGDVWYCPGCARKFHYVTINLNPEGEEEWAQAWYTNEVR